MFTGESLDLSRMLKECDLFFLVLVEVHFPSWQYVQQFVSVCLGGKKERVRCCIVLKWSFILEVKHGNRISMRHSLFGSQGL